MINRFIEFTPPYSISFRSIVTLSASHLRPVLSSNLFSLRIFANKIWCVFLASVMRVIGPRLPISCALIFGTNNIKVLSKNPDHFAKPNGSHFLAEYPFCTKRFKYPACVSVCMCVSCGWTSVLVGPECLHLLH